MPLPSPIMTAAQSFFRHTSLPRLSVLSGKVSYMLRSRRPGRTRADRPDLDALSRRIILPSMPITDEEMARAEFQDRTLKLLGRNCGNPRPIL